MSQGETVTHEGIVLKAPGDGTADVEIIVAEACAGCQARSVCSPGKSDTKVVTVKSGAALKPGDRVTVVMQLSQGFRALAIGYIIPFMVLIAAFALLSAGGCRGGCCSAVIICGTWDILYGYLVAERQNRRKI